MSQHVEAVSFVLATRNDDHGGNLARRAAVALNAMLAVADEVVLVDFNSKDAPLLTRLPTLQGIERLRHVVIDSAMCAAQLGKPCGNRFFESLARNIGLKAASHGIIVSTNIDVIPPCRSILDWLATSVASWRHAVILERVEVPQPPLEERHHAGLTEPGCWRSRMDTPIINPRMQRSVHISHLQGFGRNLFHQVSVITNCGDFQMARRRLWRHAPFPRLNDSRNFADTLLQASWLNLGVTLHAPHVDVAAVAHIQHSRPRVLDGSNQRPLLRIVHRQSGRPVHYHARNDSLKVIQVDYVPEERQEVAPGLQRCPPGAGGVGCAR